jgi:hypothetical protein
VADKLLVESLVPICNSLIKEAKNGNFQQQKTILELLGKYVQRQEIDKTVHVKIERSFDRDDKVIDVTPDTTDADSVE